MSDITYYIERINTFITDNILIFALLGAGIFLTLKTRFVQLRSFSEGIRNMTGGLFSRDKSNGISPFAALATSLAAQLGTGNIVGAGSAIITGGPGAVFWMWVCAFFGMATSYAEAVLSQKTKIRLPDGTYTGGAAYYIKYAFEGKGGKLLSAAFSLFATVALGFTGVAVQANSISVALNEALGIPVFATGLIITASAALVIFKGTGAVARFSEKTVPVMALLYMGLCVSVIVKNIALVPESIKLIFSCAFSSEALFGGITGISVKAAISQGVKRGLFTNEAGMGSTSCAHALSDAPSPHYQGTLGIAGVFVDTFLMMSLTAISVITVLFTGDTPPDTSLTGSGAVTAAFASVLGFRGSAVFVALSVFFFAFASVLGWNTFGKITSRYLFGEKSEKLYIFSSLLFVFLGSVLSGSLVWTLTDLFNTLMVITNLPALCKCFHKNYNAY